MESFLERYTTILGETFSISVCNNFEPHSGETNDGLSFRAVSVKNPENYLWGIIRISWSTKIGWGIKKGELRQALIKLGLPQIKQKLEAGSREGFAVTFDGSNTGKTLESTIAMEEDELERIKKHAMRAQEN